MDSFFFLFFHYLHLVLANSHSHMPAIHSWARSHYRFLALGLMALCVSGSAASGSLAAEDKETFDYSRLTLEQLIADSNSDGVGDSQPQDVEPIPGEVAAEAGGESAEDLAKSAQNPIASLISFPIQWNATPGTQWAPNSLDPEAKRDKTQNVINFQPVVPFKVSKDLTLVTRTIVPFVTQPWKSGTDIKALGDINPSVFFVPTLKGDLTVGLGPTLVIPSATDNRLSSKRWSAGPAFVAVYTKGPWVLGGLANNTWSFSGDDGRDVNKFLLQPFLNYNIPKGWYLTSSPIITANWNQPEDKGWSVPVGAGFGRVFKLGTQPINASLSAYYNVIKPEVAGEKLIGDWTIRTQVQFLFPTGS